VVQKGDTLFAIAFQYGLDYRDLAFWNDLASPDLIKIGQALRLTPPDDAAGRARGVETIPLRESALPSPKVIKEAPLFSEPRAQRLPFSETNWAALSTAKPATATNSRPAQPVDKTTGESGVADVNMKVAVAVPATVIVLPPAPAQGDADEWRWPAEGAVFGVFGEGGGKGINIAGDRLAPVAAAAPGKVVYSGAGLRGYGKMLIVKHAGEYLTAYAHNQNLLVKEGDWVKGGQRIAEMGDSDSERVKLHFEIRQFGKPIDPLKLLPERK
jgi:lipoprotein NlpD